MILPGQVGNAAASVPGFDSDAVITAQAAQQFFDAGYKFCLRYLSLLRQAPQDLSVVEAVSILDSGLALMPVQHAHSSGWLPSQELGQQDGQNAGDNAQGVGFPIGLNVWCDLEGLNADSAVQDVVDYCEAWHQAVAAAGYLPGLYVGAGAVLNGPQLQDLSFQHYWRSQSYVPDIPARGYQIVQFFPTVSIHGIDIDLDIVQDDDQGGQAQWLSVAI